jgi:tetratricopeptide (TPR) repeat protein
MSRVRSLSLGARSGLAVLAVTLATAGVWFFTPAPTIAARYAWEQYRAGALALLLNRSDADLAFSIGAYYFGGSSMSNIEGEPAYEPSLAERAFERVLAINPSIPSAHYMLARIKFVRSDFDGALADLNEELVRFPSNKRTLYMRALVYAYRGLSGDLLSAEQDFREFVAWAPSEWAGYNDLAFVLAKEGKYADAAAVLKEGIAKASGGGANPWLWNTLGVMELNLKKPEVALSSFLKAQTAAASLTETDWQRAYPGNDPASAREGIETMKSGIVKNIAAAREALGA